MIWTSLFIHLRAGEPPGTCHSQRLPQWPHIHPQTQCPIKREGWRWRFRTMPCSPPPPHQPSAGSRSAQPCNLPWEQSGEPEVLAGSLPLQSPTPASTNQKPIDGSDVGGSQMWLHLDSIMYQGLVLKKLNPLGVGPGLYSFNNKVPCQFWHRDPSLPGRHGGRGMVSYNPGLHRN